MFTLFSVDKMYPKKLFLLRRGGRRQTACESIWSYFIWECYSFAWAPSWSEHINKHGISQQPCFALNTPICKNRRNTIVTFSVLLFIKKKNKAMWFELWIHWRHLWWINSQGICKKWFGKFLMGCGWGMGRNRLLSPLSFWLFHWPLSLHKFTCCYNKNNPLSPLPTSLRVLWDVTDSLQSNQTSLNN